MNAPIILVLSLAALVPGAAAPVSLPRARAGKGTRAPGRHPRRQAPFLMERAPRRLWPPATTEPIPFLDGRPTRDIMAVRMAQRGRG